MYSNIVNESWLKATNGFSESIREFVPSRSVPPSLTLELEPVCVDPFPFEDEQPAAISPTASTAAIRDARLPIPRSSECGSPYCGPAALASSSHSSPKGRSSCAELANRLAAGGGTTAALAV